jgi:Phage minor capsid protein 2.
MNSSEIGALLDSEEWKLLDAYEEALAKVRQRLLEQEIRGMSTEHYRRITVDIENIIDDLRQYHYQWLIKNIPLAYEEGSAAAIEKLTQKYPVVIDNIFKSFGKVHQEAVRSIINDTFKSVAGLTQNMEDSLKEMLRDSAKEVLQPGLIMGEKRIDMTKELVQNLNKKGWTVYYDEKGHYISLSEYVDSALDENWVGFVDAAGRKWDPMYYSKMLTRTKITEAASTGTENRLTDNGLDLIIIDAHGATDWCRFYESKVFSISGQSGEYPPLSSAPNHGCPFHPLCKHREAPFVPKFETKEVIKYGQELDDEFRNLNNEKTGYADQAKLRALDKRYKPEASRAGI